MGSRNASTYAECCRIVETFPLTPVKTALTNQMYPRSFQVFLPQVDFFSTSSLEEMKVELFQHLFYLFDSWQREIHAMEGKNVLPMSIGPFWCKGGSIIEDTNKGPG